MHSSAEPLTSGSVSYLLSLESASSYNFSAQSASFTGLKALRSDENTLNDSDATRGCFSFIDLSNTGVMVGDDSVKVEAGWLEKKSIRNDKHVR